MSSARPVALECRDLRLIRQARGYSLSAVEAQTGIDRTALSRIENGARPLPPDVEIKLLRLYFGASR